jgi:hypothetical protein
MEQARTDGRGGGWGGGSGGECEGEGGIRFSDNPLAVVVTYQISSLSCCLLNPKQVVSRF